MEVKVKPELIPVINQLMPLHENDLLVFIGNENFKSELSANFLSPSQIIAKVKKLIADYSLQIRERVCNDETVKAEIEGGKMEKKLLVGHVASLLFGIWHSEIAHLRTTSLRSQPRRGASQAAHRERGHIEFHCRYLPSLGLHLRPADCGVPSLPEVRRHAEARRALRPLPLRLQGLRRAR